jgi:DNA-binding MurR/RpiR family transcriptional regulator
VEESSVDPEGVSPAADHRAIAERYPPCLGRLRGLLAQLGEAERRAALWILTHPEEALRYSVNDLARQSGVGVGTVARLCGRLGYPGFADLRIALAVEMLNPGFRTLDKVESGDDAASVIRKVTQFGAQILTDTAALLDAGALDEAAAAVAKADRIAFYAGGGYTSPIAILAQSRFLVLDVLAAAYVGEWDQAASARLLGPGDVAIGLSYTGAAPDVVDALRLAGAGGATTVAVTNTPGSPVGAVARLCLLAGSPEGWSWAHPALSRVGMLAVLDALYACALFRKYGAAGAGGPPTAPGMSRPERAG